MPAQTYTTTADLLNSTMPQWLKDRRSNMLSRDVPLLVDARKSKKLIDGGDQIIIPADFYLHSAPTRLTNGFDQIALNFAPVGLPLIQGWADIMQPIGISGNERRKNAGGAKILDLRDQRLQNVHDHFERQLHQAIIKGDLPAFTDIVPINGTDYTDGAIENAAPASQDNVVHGVSKATFAATAVGWTNQRQSIGSDFSTNGLPAMYSGHRAIRAIGKAQGSLQPPRHKGYFSPNGFDFYKRVLQPQEFYVAKDGKLDGGALADTFQGVAFELIKDDMPTNWTYLLLDWSSIDYCINSGEGERDMAQTKWFDQLPMGVDALVSYVGWMGQMMYRYLGRHLLCDLGETF